MKKEATTLAVKLVPVPEMPVRTCKMTARAYGRDNCKDTYYTFSCCGHVTAKYGGDPYRPRFCEHCGAKVVE